MAGFDFPRSLVLGLADFVLRLTLLLGDLRLLPFFVCERLCLLLLLFLERFRALAFLFLEIVFALLLGRLRGLSVFPSVAPLRGLLLRAGAPDAADRLRSG
jgi:hypothetical protein